MRVDEVVINHRHRKELGDLSSLMRSIEEVGLLHPIVVTPAGELVVGLRRVEAFRRLGRDEIPHVVVSGLTEALSLIKAERDENVCRLDFALSEAVAMAKALLPLEREAAQRRQVELGRTHGVPSDNLPEGVPGQSVDKVAAALGMSRRTLEKAMEVVDAAQGDAYFACFVEGMDRARKVSGVYQAFKRERERRGRGRGEEGALPTGIEIVTGDFRLEGGRVGDASVDLIFTDPPYEEKSIPLYGALSEFAARVLKPGGICIAYTGQHFLPQVLQEMSRFLTYGWMCALHCTGPPLAERKFNLNNLWKPLALFYRPPLQVWWERFDDHIEGGGREKELHPWQQAESEARAFVQALAPGGGLVVDPCCGSGTTPAACQSLGMKCVAFEIDGIVADRARQRLTG